jgi:hypothetical protein
MIIATESAYGVAVHAVLRAATISDSTDPVVCLPPRGRTGVPALVLVSPFSRTGTRTETIPV